MSLVEHCRRLIGPFQNIRECADAYRMVADACRAVAHNMPADNDCKALLLEAAESAAEAAQAINRYCEAVLKLNGLTGPEKEG
ncbi:MAG: hypothetical protein KGL35_11240 [Bradyrhizobium sp.]|nr:hypothetical protein [Bradyrhizobium sp.]